MATKALKLLVEMVDIKDLEILTEDFKDGKPKQYRIKGPFIQSEVKNGNNRIYPKQYVEREVNRLNETKIKQRRALGELDHRRDASVHLERASHLIESLSMMNNDAIGVAKIIDTPMGRIAKTLIDENILLGVSSRSLGTVDDNNLVESTLSVVTCDLVSDPSAPEGFVEAMVENKEYIIGDDGKILESKFNEIENQISKKYNSKVALEIMTDFLNVFMKK